MQPNLFGTGQSHSFSVCPIAALVPNRRDIAVKARVTEKSQARTWKNDRGEGTMFTIIMMDSNSDTIQAKFFTQAYERFYDVLQEGRVYIFSGGRVSMPQRPASTSSEYDMTFGPEATIEPQNDDNTIPSYSQKSVLSLDSIPKQRDTNANHDYIGVIYSATPIVNFQTRRGTSSTRRNISIVDRSELIVDVTFWGEQASNYNDADFENNPVILIRGARINEYQNVRSLQSSFNTTVSFLKDSSAQQLKSWFNTADKNQFKSLKQLSGGNSFDSGNPAQRRVFSRDRFEDLIEQEFIQTSSADEAQWLHIDGYITRYVINGSRSQNGEPSQPKFWYEACSNPLPEGRPCNKKLVSTGTEWHCDRCNIRTQEPAYRYILAATLADDSGQKLVTFFDTEAEQLLGCPARELALMVQQDASGTTVQNFLNTKNYQRVNVTVRVSVDNSREQPTVRYRAFKISPVWESKKLLQYAVEEIEHYKQQIGFIQQ